MSFFSACLQLSGNLLRLTHRTTKEKITDMKKLIVALTMLAAFALPQQAAAQKHHTAVQKHQPDTTAIDAFSDTTDVDSVDTATAVTPRQSFTMNIGTNDDDDDFFDGWGYEMSKGLVGTIGILLILFVVCPVSIIGLICYFIYRYRKQRLQLAEMAMKNGQAIPEDSKPHRERTSEDYWRMGIKNVALGLGGAVFFFFLDGVGVLVGLALAFAIYGVGQMVIAKTSPTTKAHEENSGSDLLSEKDF